MEININHNLIAYTSVTQIRYLTSYFSTLIATGLTLRCVIIFFQLIGDEISWKDAIITMKKRIIGAVFAIGAAGFVTYFKSFY